MLFLFFFEGAACLTSTDYESFKESGCIKLFLAVQFYVPDTYMNLQWAIKKRLSNKYLTDTNNLMFYPKLPYFNKICTTKNHIRQTANILQFDIKSKYITNIVN